MTYEEKLRELINADDRIMLLTAENRAAIRNLAAELNGRFLDTGITEQTMIGMAAGLALRGRIPVAHALATFITMRAFEFIRTDVGIAGLPVKLVGGVPGFLSDGNGPTHQALEDVGLMRGIPGMGVFCPADEEELVRGLPHILNSPQPFYIRHNSLPPAVAHDLDFTIGQAETVQDGTDLTILTYGFLLREAVEATRLLGERGISVRLLNMRTLAPVDETAILAAAEETGRLVTIEDHFLNGGLYSIVSEVLVRHGRIAPVHPIALENRWFRPGRLPEVLEYEGFTGLQLAEKVKLVVNGVC